MNQMDANLLGVYLATIAAFYEVLISLKIGLKEY